MEKKAESCVCGREDKFYYVISESCVRCGACEEVCPAGAIRKDEEKYEILPEKCIDCGTCSAVCPTEAAQPVPVIRESISLQDIDRKKCYFNPG